MRSKCTMGKKHFSIPKYTALLNKLKKEKILKNVKMYEEEKL